MTVAASLRSLLAGAIDYAGLFPPATLRMRDAVERYACYLRGDEAWALGRFVLPMSRLDEFAEARDAVSFEAGPWRVSALVGEDAGADARRIEAFNEEHADLALIDSVETKLAFGPSDALREIDVLSRAMPTTLATFVEIPASGELDALIAAIGAAGLRAKIRTGGVTREMFPGARNVARFLASCARHGVAFKATAGLHHPIRGRYPLTYEANPPTGTMFGFVNLLAASALQRAGVSDDEIVAMLESEQAEDFAISDACLRWRGHTLTVSALRDTRASFALSFGSCSFEEPLRDLRELGLL
jgi:hypothetical protein